MTAACEVPPVHGRRVRFGHAVVLGLPHDGWVAVALTIPFGGPAYSNLEDRADDRRRRHRERCLAVESGARGVVDKAVRTHRRGRRSLVLARAGHDHRLPRPERRRQDDDAADAPGAGRADERPCARLRPTLRGARAARASDRGGVGSDRLPPGPLRPRPPAHARRGSRPATLPRRGRSPAGRARAGCWPSRQGLLARHASAAGAGRRAARRPRALDPRRARQRARPGRRPLAPRLPARLRSRQDEPC